jgi:hypothetical protein
VGSEQAATNWSSLKTLEESSGEEELKLLRVQLAIKQSSFLEEMEKGGGEDYIGPEGG